MYFLVAGEKVLKTVKAITDLQIDMNLANQDVIRETNTRDSQVIFGPPFGTLFSEEVKPQAKLAAADRELTVDAVSQPRFQLDRASLMGGRS